MNLTSKLLSFVLTAAVLLSSVSFAAAFVPEEGMYTPDQIKSLDLKKKGLKIKPEELYNPNGVDISDAVIRLSIGCTAEFVSPQGLILTNHHCGFDALVSASTPENDLVENGFRTDSPAGELQAKDYSVFITERVDDVTATITKGTENLTGDALRNALQANVKTLTDAEQAKAPKGSTIRIQGLNSGFYYYLYQTKEIKDIRVVYAPPRNIGIFGGDPDNFEWTRHTGDFTFLRAYVAPDGSSAAYSASNVPYKPIKHLTVNIGETKENDFVFVMGYPGTTTRYRESQAVEFAENVNFPFLSQYLQARSDALSKAAEGDDEKRIKFQSEIANFDNYRKAYGGGAVALRRGNALAAKKAEETRFAAWVAADPKRQAKYGQVLANLNRVDTDYYSTGARDTIVRTFPPNPQYAVMPIFRQVYDAFVSVQQGKDLTNAEKAEKLKAIKASFENKEPVFERELMKFFLLKFAELPDGQKFAAAENLFGKLKGDARRAAEEEFAKSIVENKDFSTPEEIVALYSLSEANLKRKYPKIADFMDAFAKEKSTVAARTAKFGGEIDALRLLYQQGMAEMRGVRPYPDANSTLRFTYGNIRGYSPREAVSYTPFTTLKGMIEKDTGVKPFDVPQKLKDLQQSKDFGRFGQGDSVIVNLLATTDIIGGNSGSPMLNGNGEQIGLVFDGNYEGLGNDIFYSPSYGRTIAVDIRYVLFVTEKFGNAGWILNEMTIKGGKNAKGKGA